MEKRWNIELYEGANSFKVVAYYLHRSDLWNLAIKVNGLTETAIQTDDPTKDALSLIADAQAELEHEALDAYAQQNVAAAA